MKIFNRVLLYFQLLGICVISIDTSQNRIFNSLIRGLNILHTFIAIFCGFSIYYFEDYMFYVGDVVTRSTDIIQIAVPILAHFIIVFDAGNLKRKNQEEIWMNFSKINQIFEHFDLDLEQWKLKVFHNYSWKLFVWVVISIGIYVQIMRKVYEADPGKSFFNFAPVNFLIFIEIAHVWFHCWCLAVFPYIVCQSSIFYYCLYVDLVKEYLILLNEEIRTIGVESKSSSIRENNLFYNLKFLKDAHNVFCDVNLKINAVFGWSHLVNLTAFFIVLTVDFYWIYFHIKLTGRDLEGFHYSCRIIKIVC